MAKRLGLVILLLMSLTACGGVATELPAPARYDKTIRYCAITAEGKRTVLKVEGSPLQYENSFMMVKLADGHTKTYDRRVPFVCADTLEGLGS